MSRRIKSFEKMCQHMTARPALEPGSSPLSLDVWVISPLIFLVSSVSETKLQTQCGFLCFPAANSLGSYSYLGPHYSH